MKPAQRSCSVQDAVIWSQIRMAYAAFAVRMPFNVAIAGMCCDSKIAICHKRLASLDVLPRNIIALARSFLHLHLVWSLRVDRAGPDLVYSLRHLFQIPLSTTKLLARFPPLQSAPVVQLHAF